MLKLKLKSLNKRNYFRTVAQLDQAWIRPQSLDKLLKFEKFEKATYAP